MSFMLDQAIVDAAALREAALKNAEITLIEKFAPQIKEAVESLLEGDDEAVAEESELDEIPMSSTAPDGEVEMSVDMFEFKPEDFQIHLGTFDKSEEEKAADEEELTEPDPEPGIGLEAPPTEEAPIGDMGADMGAGGGGLGLDLQENDKMIEDLASMLQELVMSSEDDEEEPIEEELVVDTSAQKHGSFVTDEATRSHDRDLELARMESTKVKEENEALLQRVDELDENLKRSNSDSRKLSKAVVALNEKLQESILQNAKLLYSNRVLSDASLNERQKTKIVEAIAQAKTANEAKTLCETLKATVGEKVKHSPKSLSESVQRKSNLSAILPRRNKQEKRPDSFNERMQRLAGIK